MKMKYQLVLSTYGIFETIFIAALQDITFQSRVSLTTSVYQVQMILILLGVAIAEG